MKFSANKQKINKQCINYNGYVSPVKYIIIFICNYIQYIISLKYRSYNLQFMQVLTII